MDYVFEVCANSVESCIAAQEGGAQRVELCAGIPEGGTTPSCGEIRIARRSIDIGLNVIIRPRGGDFLYIPLELDIMEHDIMVARDEGADGVVFGCLLPDGGIDVDSVVRLKKAAGSLPITFHRAFDYVRDPNDALERLVDLGIDRVLTSGQQPTALQGVRLLAELVKQAGDRISVMPGCGITPGNIRSIAEATGAHEFHFSAREKKESRMLLRNPALSMGSSDVDEYSCSVTTPDKVRATIAAIGCR